MLTDEDKRWITEQLSEQLTSSERRTAERIEATETKLLTAFHQCAQMFEIRLRS